MNWDHLCRELTGQAKAASIGLNAVDTRAKNAWLLAAADRLERSADRLTAANEQDLARAPDYGLTNAAIDRLRLTSKRITAAAEGLRQVAALPDPVGTILEGQVRPNGLRVQKVAVPIGVILFLYESRPNVTVDAAALSVKSGNAVILRGGKEAIHSNAELHQLLAGLLPEFGLPEHAVQLVTTTDRTLVGHLLKAEGQIDLVIPRGGESLIRRVAAEAVMPVLKHFAGNCHIYVDAKADLEMAERVVVNAKCQRPGVCNAAETLLIHEELAETFLPRLAGKLIEQGVELRGCERTCQLVPQSRPATDDDYATEFLELILAVRVVPTLQAAIEHIARFGSGHTEAIITDRLPTADEFCRKVDASAVVVNASTRFNDGFELGLGAEIGISTDKFHARGPCGLKELTTYKYLIHGQGQLRE